MVKVFYHIRIKRVMRFGYAKKGAINPQLQAKPQDIFYVCTGMLVSDLVLNPKDRISCDEAHISQRMA